MNQVKKLQAALKRQDVSLVAVGLSHRALPSDVVMFCKEQVHLELQAVPEVTYYASLQKHYQPVRMLGWVVVLLVAGAGVFAGLNTMYGAVVGRVRLPATRLDPARPAAPARQPTPPAPTRR